MEATASAMEVRNVFVKPCPRNSASAVITSTQASMIRELARHHRFRRFSKGSFSPAGTRIPPCLRTISVSAPVAVTAILACPHSTVEPAYSRLERYSAGMALSCSSVRITVSNF